MITTKRLKAFDPVRFADESFTDKKGKVAKSVTNDDAAYYLTTWLFDYGDYKVDAIEGLKKIVESFPELWKKVMDNYINGNHDT
jgi:hypothetical protein